MKWPPVTAVLILDDFKKYKVRIKVNWLISFEILIQIFETIFKINFLSSNQLSLNKTTNALKTVIIVIVMTCNRAG